MRYILRNLRPSVVLVPDAALRLEVGQTVTVHVLTPQLRGLLMARALEVVTPPPAPRPPHRATAARRNARPREKRQAASSLVTEANDDAQ